MSAVAKALTDNDAKGLMLKAPRLIDQLTNSHYAWRGRPVFRWTKFSTYAQQCCWFDGNNNRAFGGVNPQQWGDGNYQAHRMSNDMRVLKR